MILFFFLIKIYNLPFNYFTGLDKLSTSKNKFTNVKNIYCKMFLSIAYQKRNKYEKIKHILNSNTFLENINFIIYNCEKKIKNSNPIDNLNIYKEFLNDLLKYVTILNDEFKKFDNQLEIYLNERYLAITEKLRYFSFSEEKIDMKFLNILKEQNISSFLNCAIIVFLITNIKFLIKNC